MYSNNQSRFIILGLLSSTTLILLVSIKILTLRLSEKNPSRREPICPTGLIGVGDSGRLGNQLSQFATIKAYEQLVSRKGQAAITITMQRFLMQYFKSISATVFDTETLKTCDWVHRKPMSQDKYYGKTLQAIESEENVFIEGNPVDVALILRYRSTILNGLTFKDVYIQHSKRLISTGKEKYAMKYGLKINEIQTIGVHVRRTDYAQWILKLKGRLPTAEFFNVAMAFYIKKLKNPLFIIASDDVSWVKHHFQRYKNVIFTSDFKINDVMVNSDGLDLAVLSLCDHSIVDHGTYSFMAAILNKGHKVIVYGTTFIEHLIQKELMKLNFSDWTFMRDPCIVLSNNSVILRKKCLNHT